MRLLLIISLFVLGTTVYAQQDEPKPADVVELIDGSKLKGFIVQKFDNGDIQLDLFGEELLNIKSDQISNIVQEAENKLYYPDGRSYTSKGYFATLRVSSSWGSESNENEGSFSGMHIHTVHGIQFTPKIAGGGGIVLDILSGPSNNTYTFLPIYVDMRYYPIRSKVSPFVAVSGGVSLAFDLFNNFVEVGEGYDSGIFGKLSVGTSFSTKRQSQFFVDLSVFTMDSHATFQDYLDGEIPVFVDEEITFRRWEIGFGWIF